ncbi:hypothetical protein NN3_55370 [Nocardia neocaledoniensis NBRC 108232]|nr:hypothetical protein NN3_55370 [Nocardia neocaledoniensis NBRC 108232]
MSETSGCHSPEAALRYRHHISYTIVMTASGKSARRHNMGSFDELLLGILGGMASANQGDLLLETFLGSLESFFP